MSTPCLASPPCGLPSSRGAVVGLCIALTACGQQPAPAENAFRECRYENGERFYFRQGTQERGGPLLSDCYIVTDTEGWERRYCTSGEMAAICRTLPALPDGARLLPPGSEIDE